VILALGLIALGALGGIEMACGPMSPCPALLDRRDGSILLVLALALITILATITTIQRILHVRAQAQAQSTSNDIPTT
jgi:hypothetical protein